MPRQEFPKDQLRAVAFLDLMEICFISIADMEATCDQFLPSLAEHEAMEAEVMAEEAAQISQIKRGKFDVDTNECNLQDLVRLKNRADAVRTSILLLVVQRLAPPKESKDDPVEATSVAQGP